jgi:RNA polymerase sigma factor (sigma-70 family)
VKREEEELDRLMARLADGDRDAFDPLFRALHPRAVRLARARLPGGGADDAAQSTMLKVFEHASDFRPGAPALPWFYAIAGNEVRAARRRARPMDGDGAIDGLAADDDPERRILDEELHASLERAIESLDPDGAEAIAAMLGRAARPCIADATFRKRVSRVYARLRLLLGGSRE